MADLAHTLLLHIFREQTPSKVVHKLHDILVMTVLGGFKMTVYGLKKTAFVRSSGL